MMNLFKLSTTQADDNISQEDYYQAKSLDVSVAFPQATPASTFPPCVSDYYQFDDLLTSEEKSLRNKVRTFMEKEVAPIMSKYWEKAEFPFELIPKFGALRIAGGTIKGYGCPGYSITANAILAAEMARVDSSCSTFIAVHSHMAMQTIALCGFEEQKEKYLPSLANLNTIACFAITEPDRGSDLGSLTTIARKVEGGWILEGQKRWIGNCTFADIMIIIARNTETNHANGFIVKKGAPGLQTAKIENKIGQRILQNGDIVMNKVFVPDEDKLPGINSFEDVNKVLVAMRIFVAWHPIGVAMGVYDMCQRYLKERQQFGAPLAEFQLNQQKLVCILGNIQAMFVVGWRLCNLYDSKKITPGRASLSKSWLTLKGRETVALGRELLGGNGIVTDYFVAKAFCDLEPAYTYEGTYDINTMITGMEITGISCLKPAPSRKHSRL